MIKKHLFPFFLFLIFMLAACSEPSVTPPGSTPSTPTEAETTATIPSLYAPYDSDAYIGMNYADAETVLKEAGFAQVVLIPVDDINSNSGIADGAVVSVVIDGVTEYSSTTRFDVDASVVITYHNIPKIVAPITSADAGTTPYMDIGKRFFDAGFTMVETDEIVDLPADSSFNTVLTANGKPVEQGMLLPFDCPIRVIGHYSIPEYSVILSIDFEENWLFSKYGVTVDLNGKELGKLSHGEDATYELALPAGTYTLFFTNTDDHEISGSVAFEVTSETNASYHISCYSDEVKVKKKEFTQALAEGELLMPFSSNHYLRKDYKAIVDELKALGFTNVTAVPVIDHFWSPSDVNSVVRIMIGKAASFDREQKVSKAAAVNVYYHVADFEFEHSSISVTEKDTFELAYTMTSGDSLDSLAFEIDHPEILQRNEDGTYTALIPGTANVTVSSGGNIYSSCIVEVAEIIVPIDSVTFNADEMDVVVGSTFTLNYKTWPENANYTDMSIELSTDGFEQCENDTFYVKEPGDTEILFYQDDRLLGYCLVHASVVEIEELIFADSNTEIFIGESCNLSFTLLPENATCKGIRVESSDKKVAEVTFDERGPGLVAIKGISAGTAIITITLPNGTQYTHTITVKEIDPSEIKVVNTAPDTRIEVGTPISLSVTWVPDHTSVKELVWSSSNSKVIKVSSDGTLEAVGVGSADITATHKSGITGTITLTVEPTIVSGIVLNTYRETLTKGDKFTIDAYVIPKNATNQTLTFQSSDESVAKVSSKGVVTAVSVGTAVIQVISPDGPVEEIEVTVSPTPQKFKIKWSASLISNDHVGSNWSKTFEVNDKKFSSGSTFTLDPDSSFTICLTIEENDSRPDTEYYFERITYSEDLCKNGYTVSETLYVRENGGRYSGNVAEWKIKITITPVN